MNSILNPPLYGDYDPLNTEQLEESLRYILGLPIPWRLEELLYKLEKHEEPECETKPARAN